jgi:L-aminopeptidase/D-esterase-like protein
MEGLKIGHFTHEENGTGVSVFLVEHAARGAYLLCGSGPASLELATLNTDTSVSHLHGLVLTGGSAFGLYAAKGVMRYLAEKGIGLALPHGVVPIVPAAGIYDLAYKKAIPPTDEDAYQACLSATVNNQQSGRRGAGTGATIGKIIPQAQRMSGGLGYAEITLPDGVQVIAYVVVNAVGDVRDMHGQIVAGARWANGEFADCKQFLISGQANEILIPRTENTTLAAVFTNAKFTKAELKRIAKMAIAGVAQAISPIFTCYDGDILFAISLGKLQAAVMTVGTMAAEAVRLAILDAVKESVVI